LIGNLKFRHRIDLSLPLARLLIRRLAEAEDLPDLILPVPLHSRRLRERGFNQAQELGRVVARHYQIPLDSRLVKRTRETSAQSDLSLQERRKNLRSAFKVFGNLKDISSGFGFPAPGGIWRLKKEMSGGGPLMDVGIYCPAAVLGWLRPDE
jgi:predicted amidophosphoribosyltransferase